MRHWFTRADAPIVQTHVKRFDPLHWTVDFPRGTIASVITAQGGHGLTVRAEFLREGDLVGLIYDSEDRFAHPAHAREVNRDYSHCILSFRWESSGLIALDALNGPTLTIEGEDADGNPRRWFVRLWNYADGSPTSAEVRLDFDELNGGFALPADADRVDPRRIDRMFISLVPPGYAEGSQTLFGSPVAASVTISDVRCEGSGSVLAINDAVAPEHSLRVATAYDDMYNLPPERVVQSAMRLGYRKLLNHYVGMSHYFALDSNGKLEPSRGINAPALAWHRDFARAAAEHGFGVIWSISYEILDMFCPEGWKQRTLDGTPAATAWDPPSTLVSPANAIAIDYLARIAQELIAISAESGLEPQLQIGEPWWWITPAGAICLYDAAAQAALGGNPVAIDDVRGTLTASQTALLDQAGALLAASTATITGAAKQADIETQTLLLTYLPSVLDPAAPEARRANLPAGWASPAFDVLQTEDYEWVTGRRDDLRAAAYELVNERLGYPKAKQHYFSGFVLTADERAQWRSILAAASEAGERGCAETFLWALPQVIRDGLTIFGEGDDMFPFDEVVFPIEIGAEASVSPGFSTSVVTSASGFETRNVNWSQARLRFDAGPGVRADAELETLLQFFRARRGPAIGFRFRDPYDHSSNGMTGAAEPMDQQIGIGDGSTTAFDLAKAYGAGERRRITRPVAGTVRVAVDGIELLTGWSLQDKGVVQFAAPPSAEKVVTAGFIFDTPVRFAEDRLEINRATFRAGEAPSVPLIEVREA